MQISLLAGRAWAEMGITAQNRSALSFSSTLSTSCLSGEGRYVFEYYKCHRYDIKYSMMKSLPVVGIYIIEIMIFGIISNVL